MLKNILSLSVILLLANSSFAITEHDAQQHKSRKSLMNGEFTDDVNQYTSSLIDNAFKILNNKSLSEKQKTIQAEELMEKNLDIEWMAKYSLGRQARGLAHEKFEKYKQAYDSYVVKSYSRKIHDYKGERIVINSVNQTKQDIQAGVAEYAVSTLINSSAKGNNINVKFMIRKKNNKFYIFDIVTERVSLITAQRSEFNNVIASGGIDNLTKLLLEKSK